ncbi:MAG TPA: vitamin K epoxide reductase family protein [Candidatus Saccharimonadales bacterium]|nr:vitamin K epoxide reductase family protein [Candidatus Saccharimonadales bacterium]
MPYAISILSFLGFLDATYLTILHYQNAIPPCTLSGCEMVLTSKFATVSGVPIALFGSIFYLSIFFLSIFLLQTKHRLALWLLVALANAGFVVALVLLFIQAGILHNFCMYCLGSEIISTLIFAATLLILRNELEKPAH